MGWGHGRYRNSKICRIRTTTAFNSPSWGQHCSLYKCSYQRLRTLDSQQLSGCLPSKWLGDITATGGRQQRDPNPATAT